MMRTVSLRTIKIDRGLADLLTDEAGNFGIEEAQEDIGFLLQKVDDVRVAEQLDPDAGIVQCNVLNAAGEVAARQPLHCGHTDGPGLGLDMTDRLMHGGGMHLHQADMFEQVLGLRPCGNAAVRAVKKAPLQDQFDMRDPPGHRGVIDLQDLCRTVDAALTCHFEDHPKVVPSEPVQLRHDEFSRRAFNERGLTPILQSSNRPRQLPQVRQPRLTMQSISMAGRTQTPVGAKTPNARVGIPHYFAGEICVSTLNSENGGLAMQIDMSLPLRRGKRPDRCGSFLLFLSL